MTSPDARVLDDDWSDLSRIRPLPNVDHARLYAYRTERMRASLPHHGAAMPCSSPISLRYALDYRTYPLWQSHAHTTYAFAPVEGSTVAYNVYGNPPGADHVRVGRQNTYFDGGPELPENARLIAQDICDYLSEIGSDNRRVAVEYVNPSLTQALLQRGLEVIDGVAVAEEARVIKSPDEIMCIKWAVEVAEHGISPSQGGAPPPGSRKSSFGGC